MPVLDQQNLTYKQLQMKYSEMAFPRALVELGGKQFENKAGDMFINDIHVELSAGFEASVASFRIYNVFDSEEGCFRFEEIKKQVVIGKSVTIKLHGPQGNNDGRQIRLSVHSKGLRQRSQRDFAAHSL